MSRFLRPILLCLCVITVASATVDARPTRKLAKFKPDIAVSEVKKLVKDDVARWDEFKGNDFYESGPEVPAQNIILDGGKKVTERYLVAIDNDGTKSDEIRVKIDIPEEVTTVEKRSAAEKFEATIYAATLTGPKMFRGDDVTEDFSGNGVIVELRPGERVFYWIEISGLKGFRKNDYVAIPMRARSVNGSRAAIPVSENPYDTVVPAREDYFFVTFGKAGEILIPGGGGGGGDGADAIDWKTVIWPGPMNVGPWDTTSNLTFISQNNFQICLGHTKNTSWPTALEPGGGVFVNGNMWAIVNLGGARGAAAWYAGIFEWLTPGLVCQSLGSGGSVTVAQQMANHFFFAPLRGHVPKAGDKIYFFVSAPAWPGHVNPIVFERTQFREWIWK